MVDISIFLIYKTCKKIIDEKYAFLSLIISIIFLGFSPWIAVVYTDTVSLPFAIGIFYTYILIKENKTNLQKLFAIITALSIVGFLIKPTNIIILIAIFGIEILNLNKFFISKNKKDIIENCLKNILVIIVTTIIIFSIFGIYKNVRLKSYISKQDFENNSMPITHWAMMGLKPVNYGGKYLGGYNKEDFNATKSQIGQKAKIEYNISEIKNRLNSLRFDGYVKYIYDKYTWIISDGTFTYGEEGDFYTSRPYVNNILSKIIQEYAYIGNEGYGNISINIMQTIWLYILINIFIGTIIDFVDKNNEYTDILRLAIIGIILFILLFEARARYLINYIPIFIVLCVYGINNIRKNFSGR